MSIWKAVVTEKGDALLAKMTQGHTLEITHAEIGAGQVDITLLKQQTSVSTVKGTATVEPVGYPEEGMCALPVTITNEGVTAGYGAWQIGVFANDPDEGKILFFLAQAEDVATNVPSAALMPSYKSPIIFYVEYGAADSVTVDVNPANTVSQAGMENYVSTQIARVTAESLGLGNVDNTADNDKYVAYAQRAGEADQVKNALTIRVNGGRTENTDQWTFDGSTGRSINITPDKIGAAAADHTHTPASIGAAAASHTHTEADITGPIPVAKGGTGATTAAEALSNLGAAPADHYHYYLLTKSCNNTDVNTLTTPGIYYGYTGMTHAAEPEGVSYIEIKRYQPDWLTQTQVRIGSEGSLRIHIRSLYGGTTWSPWRRVLTNIFDYDMIGSTLPTNPQEGQIFLVPIKKVT